MPQMSPIYWLWLYLLFILTYLMFNIMNYFIYSPLIKSTKKKTFKQINFNWKW